MVARRYGTRWQDERQWLMHIVRYKYTCLVHLFDDAHKRQQREQEFAEKMASGLNQLNPDKPCAADDFARLTTYVFKLQDAATHLKTSAVVVLGILAPHIGQALQAFKDILTM